FYLAAQRGVRTLLPALLRVPLVMAVGLGLSVNQTRAVLEGLIGPTGEFVRTPKTGAVGRVRPARAPRGRRGRLELALALYFAGAGVAAACGGHLLVVPYLALAAVGLAWVGAAQL